MSKGFLYSIIAIFGLLILFILSNIPFFVTKTLLVVILPVFFIIALIHFLKKGKTSLPITDILLKTFAVIAVASVVTPLLLVMIENKSINPFEKTGDGYVSLAQIAVFFIVTIPSLLAYIVTYLIKVARSKN